MKGPVHARRVRAHAHPLPREARITVCLSRRRAIDQSPHARMVASPTMVVLPTDDELLQEQQTDFSTSPTSCRGARRCEHAQLTHLAALAWDIAGNSLAIIPFHLGVIFLYVVPVLVFNPNLVSLVYPRAYKRSQKCSYCCKLLVVRV